MITFLIGLSIGASVGVLAAGVCFASHEREPEPARIRASGVRPNRAAG